MKQGFHTTVAVFSLVLGSSGAAQGPSSVASDSGRAAGQSVGEGPSAGLTSSDDAAAAKAILLGLTQEWVRTWNEKDVDRMQQLHDSDFLYGIYGRFMDGQKLLKLIREEDFWGLTYNLKMVEPRVRLLSSDTALVLFQLEGKSVGPKGARPYASLFTLVYQRRGGDWKIIHVHDSEPSENNS